jgi:Mn2+/Fe2+ NRAMP family transporter
MSLVAGVSYLLLVPLVAFLVWFVIWRVPFERMEELFGLMGLALIVFVVALVKLGPDWGAMATEVVHPAVPHGETIFTYAYFGIALFGAAMTPYEVFFFSSGGVEEKWSASDLVVEQANVLVGFPLGGVLSLAIMGVSSLLFLPLGISVGTLPVVALPIAVAVGKIGLAVVIIGIFAATFGAALETALSAGYTVGQYLGWQWGKLVAPKDAARFHAVVLLSILAGMLFIESGVDPIKVTEYSIVLSAAALPLTYFPILVIANDPDYMGDKVNGRVRNALGVAYLGLLVAVALAAVPLIIITKGGA